MPSLSRKEGSKLSKRVYLHYDQESLDRAFDQQSWASDAGDVLARYRGAGKVIREGAKLLANQPYGARPEERLDVYLTDRPNAPIHIHFHGGAWRWLSKDDVAYPAPTLTAGGVHYVVPDFSPLPSVTLLEVVDQVARVVAWTYANAGKFNGDPNRIYVSGHSSGAHLCAVLLTTELSRYGLPSDVLKGALCISGIYDVEPVLLSARGTYVKLSAQQALELSPLRHVDSIKCPVSVVYAEHDSPEFVRQSQTFHAALVATAKTTEVFVAPGMNHFEVAEELASLAYRCKGLKL
jgi:arylformamidase